MDARIETVLSTDPRRRLLEDGGWSIVGESWGARLRLPEPPDLSSFARAVAAVVSAGVDIRELDGSWMVSVASLEASTHADYPDTPATRQPARSSDDFVALARGGTRYVGAVDGGTLVGLTAITAHGDYAETEFTSVLESHRRRGIARAVKAASILALAADGVRTFGTGGAQVNAASIRRNESLGYVVEERWISFAEPST
jgi:GNAT superfamily N-acetyltransferase